MKTSLICLTSCNRFEWFKFILLDYVVFCKKNPGFQFLVSLDGLNNDYINFCDRYRIPLIYSEAREGVGLSKNRVLHHYPNYDYYFFIDDDVELLDGQVFIDHVTLSDELSVHHLSLGEDRRFFGNRKVIEECGVKILMSDYGSGAFNFFTRKGLSDVGGWHTAFAKYKRFGHTEHTYRFYTRGIQRAPFLVLINYIKGYFFWHNPTSVTIYSESSNENQISKIEQEIMNLHLQFFPVTTIYASHRNNYINVKEIDSNYLYIDLLAFKNSFYRKLLFNYNEIHESIQTELKISMDNITNSKSYKIGNLLIRMLLFFCNWKSIKYLYNSNKT